jgi:hypothetical protein
MLGIGTIKKVRAAGYGIGKPLQEAGKKMQKNASKMVVAGAKKGGPMTIQGKTMNQVGRGIHAMGMRPGRTIAGGVVGASVISSRPTAGNARGMDMGTQLRQDTSYNQQMRSGQSSALSGLQPRSMGGYA